MRRLIAAVPLLLAASLVGCGTRPPTQAEVESCGIAQKTIDSLEDAFVDRVREIRGRHVLLVEYDRQMLAVLGEYRDQLQAIIDGEKAVAGASCACTGKLQADLTLVAQPKLDRVQHFLGTFEKALRQDPKDSYLP